MNDCFIENDVIQFERFWLEVIAAHTPVTPADLKSGR